MYPIVATQPKPGNHRAAALRIADAADIRRIAPIAGSGLVTPRDPGSGQTLVAAVQPHLRQPLTY